MGPIPPHLMSLYIAIYNWCPATAVRGERYTCICTCVPCVCVGGGWSLAKEGGNIGVWAASDVHV